MVRLTRWALLVTVFVAVAVDAQGSKDPKPTKPLEPRTLTGTLETLETLEAGTVEPASTASASALCPDAGAGLPDGTFQRREIPCFQVPRDLHAPAESEESESEESDTLKLDTPPKSDTQVSQVSSTGAGSGAGPLVPIRPGPQDGALREILQIRREQGSLFRGTVFEELTSPDSEDEFLRALRKAAKEQKAAAAAPSAACEASYAELIRQEQAYSSDPGTSDLELIESLRIAGRQLDRKAADMEDSREYVEADRLRDLAHVLRIERAALAPATQLPPRQAGLRIPISGALHLE